MTMRPWASCAILVLSGSLACSLARKSVSPKRAAAPIVIKDPATGMELVLVKGGCYRMGNTFGGGGPEEKPVHKVCLRDFFIGKYEVTQAQWKNVMGSNPSHNSSCGDDCPVEMVSWNDTQAFLRALNDKGGGDPKKAYRLPTEAEWEYAARSRGQDERYAGRSDEVDSVGWYYGNQPDESSYVSHRVGLKAPNGIGLFDMTGNVWEWTNDWYGESYYSSSPRDNPTGPISGVRRVLRGGSFANAAFDVRNSYRNYLPPDFRGAGKGFRIVKAAPLPIAPSPMPPPEHAPALEATSASASPAPHKDRTTGMEFVHVKGGCFQMGDIYDDSVAEEEAQDGEKPVHEVCVGDFYIGKYEVTQGQWKAIMRANPSNPGNCPADDCPVDAMTGRDVELFIGELNSKSGGGKYRLPTEAEWEYAARGGGKNERYSGGNDLDSVSWYDVTTAGRHPPEVPEVHPVGTKAPNGLGIHDMTGNVYELTSDRYDFKYYSSSPRNDPAGPASGEKRVKRGGCVNGPPNNQRVARRTEWEDPSYMTGFRLVWTP